LQSQAAYFPAETGRLFGNNNLVGDLTTDKLKLTPVRSLLLSQMYEIMQKRKERKKKKKKKKRKEKQEATPLQPPTEIFLLFFFSLRGC
jgi:hypothetical protein